MNKAAAQLEAGGLVPTKTKVDPGATEQIVARTYRHAALGDRAVIRLASDRLGQAEDLAMEFLGFPAPEVSAPLALQQRRSLGFAAWARQRSGECPVRAGPGQADEGRGAAGQVEAGPCLGCVHGDGQGTGPVGAPFPACFLGGSGPGVQGSR